MNRGTFLASKAAGLAGAACVAPSSMADSPDAVRPALLDLIPDEAEIRAIGRTYLDRFPAESDPLALHDRIAVVLQKNTPPDAACQEFARAEAVQLRGWILARTEARQCALYSAVN
jgi:hypothetical protein